MHFPLANHLRGISSARKSTASCFVKTRFDCKLIGYFFFFFFNMSTQKEMRGNERFELMTSVS
jgi:hypothetical protein